jgi:predicted GH43/DUF377 family glycosyl hydrolase
MALRPPSWLKGSSHEPVPVASPRAGPEPEAEYERRSDGGGGCEDPRITYVEPLKHSMAIPGREAFPLCHFTSHHRLAGPIAPWERLKIGGGTPPILTRHGWLILYHGVSGSTSICLRSTRCSTLA